MSSAIWLILYDVATRDEATYLSWFHDVHIPEKLARPGYIWAAHYELVMPDGQPALLDGSPANAAKRGFLAFFGGEDSRTFLNPSPAQIKPTQTPLTREMMGLRIGSQSLIASEEWCDTRGENQQPASKFVDVTIANAGSNDEDYGAWCIQNLFPRLSASPGFEALSKLLATTNAAKHIIVGSYASLGDIKTLRKQPATDEWSKRVDDYQNRDHGSPMLGRRIWPQI